MQNHYVDIFYTYYSKFVLNIKTDTVQIAVCPIIMITGYKQRAMAGSLVIVGKKIKQFCADRRIFVRILHPIIKKVTQDNRGDLVLFAITEQINEILFQSQVFLITIGSQMDIAYKEE